MTLWDRWLRRDRVERQLDAELRDHVERMVADSMTAGISESEARRRAAIEFGGLDQIKELCRDVRGTRWFDDAVQDVRYALRTFRRSPAFVTAAVTTLASGIGAVASVFAVTWAVLWAPLGAPAPERLVWIEAQSKTEAGQSSPGAFAAWQTDVRTLTDLAAIRPATGVIADAIGADRVRGAFVTDSLLPLLGVQPTSGRGFLAEDTQPGAPRVLLIAHALWLGRYGGDASVVGRAVTFNGAPATIVGVLPASASTALAEADWWSPLILDAKDRVNTGPRYLDVIGRLAPSASLDAARADLSAVSARLQLTQDDGTPLDVAVTPLLRHVTAPYDVSLRLLFAGVLALVVIASTNVAGLLLTRSHDRAAELAIRAAVGATRMRLVRQLLIEAGVLATLSLAAGLLLAMWFIGVLTATLPADVPRLADVRLDGRVVLFAAAVATVLTGLVGIAPAIRGGAADLQSVMRAAAAGVMGHERLRRAFVIAQVAVAVVLCLAAALLAQSARALDAAPRGYEAGGVLTTSLTFPVGQYRETFAIAAAIDRILAGVSSVPGVRAVTASSQLPFAGGSPGADVALQEEAFTDGVDRQVKVRLVAPGYLTTLGGRVREGREIGARDAASTQPVVVINRALARRLVPDGSPLGRAVKFSVPVFNGPDGTRVYTVIGITEDTWDRGPREAVRPEVMLPIAQTPSEVFAWISREMHLAVRTTGEPLALSSSIRRAVSQIDPRIPLGAATTLEDRVAAAFAREHLIASLLTALGLAGVAVALVGLAAVIDQHVRRRRREIAIRVALGASPTAAVRHFVRDGAFVASAGVAAGAVMSLAVTPALSTLLFGVEPRDALTFVSVAGALLLSAIAAAWVPARRAAHVAPAETLRT